MRAKGEPIDMIMLYVCFLTAYIRWCSEDLMARRESTTKRGSGRTVFDV